MHLNEDFLDWNMLWTDSITEWLRIISGRIVLKLNLTLKHQHDIYNTPKRCWSLYTVYGDFRAFFFKED